MDTNAYAVARAFSNSGLSDLELTGVGVLLIILILIGVWSQIKDPPRKE